MIGPDVGVDQASDLPARMRGEKLITSQLLEIDQFPDRWFGYEGVDVLLVTTGEESPLERLERRAVFGACSSGCNWVAGWCIPPGSVPPTCFGKAIASMRCDRASWMSWMCTGRLRDWRISPALRND